jgi:hypothetical protein
MKTGSKRLIALLTISTLLISALLILDNTPAAQAAATTYLPGNPTTDKAYEKTTTGSSAPSLFSPDDTLSGHITDYTKVQFADGTTYDTVVSGSGTNSILAQQNYHFQIGESTSDIIAILVEWKGKTATSSASTTSGVDIKTGSTAQAITSSISSSTLTWYSLLITSGLGNYLDASNKLYFRAWVADDKGSGGEYGGHSCTLSTDIARVTVYTRETVTTTIFNTVTSWSTQYSTITTTETTTESTTIHETLFPTSEGQAFVFVGAALGPVRVTKPAGTASAAWVDSTAAAIVMGMIEDTSFSFDTNSTAINPTTGHVEQPPIPKGSTIIMSGGPLVNGPVKYYETNYATENEPVHFGTYINKGITYNAFYDASNNEIGNTAADLSKLGNSLDYFVIQIFKDSQNPQNTIVIIYGYTGYGTFAAALYFKTVLFPTLGKTVAPGYAIVRWQDTNGNHLPDTADSYQTVAHSSGWL